MRGLWEDFDQYMLIPQCTCPIPCACLAMRNAKGFRDEDRIIQFLNWLNEDYQGVASHVLLMDPLPQISRVFSMIMRQERKMKYIMISAPAVSLDETTTGLVNVGDGQREFRIGEYRKELFKEENVILNLDSGCSQFHYDVLVKIN